MNSEPPKSFRATPENRDFAITIGVRFNGFNRNDVFAYDVAGGWIETVPGAVLFGTVEPYWRRPAARVSTIVHDDDAALAKAQAKRQRRAARRQVTR